MAIRGQRSRVQIEAIAELEDWLRANHEQG